MEIVIVLAFVALAGAVLVGVQYVKVAARNRVATLRDVARARGWHAEGSDAGLARRWTGAPFHPGGGVARNVVSGQHRGRDFVAFEYLYEVKPTPHAKTAIPHRYAVVTVTLPAAVPHLALARERPLGDAVARALDLPRVDVADDEFGRRFHVTSADPLFAAKVLQPLVVEHLKAAPAWEWRFDGQTMLAYEKGHLEPDRLAARLDAMADVLDRVPADAWGHYGHTPS